MNNSAEVESQPIPLRRYGWILIAVWTVVVAASLGWNLRQQGRETLEIARTMARAHYEKDILYRRWISGHGGVYVATSPQTPPSPYLRHIPERDLVTPGGRSLTLVNPAYMTRQVYELAQQAGLPQGHITSLKPIRAENVSDAWEAASLKAFEQGATEVSAVVDMKGKAYLRLMRALITEQNCLPCHARQGYKVGDIRGGISVVVPSAMVSVSISQLLDQRNHEIVPPGEILGMLDREYPLERFDKFFTISYLVLNIRDGVIRYSNAGHPPPALLRRDGSLELLDMGGTIIGLGGPIPFEEGETRLFPGDKLFIYTDGIQEYQNRKGEFFGEKRFYMGLQRLKEKHLSEIIDGVIDALMVFGDNAAPQDDLSILGLDIMGQGK